MKIHKIKMLIVVYENCISSLGLIKCAWNIRVRVCERVCALLRLGMSSYSQFDYGVLWLIFSFQITSKQVHSAIRLLN